MASFSDLLQCSRPGNETNIQKIVMVYFLLRTPYRILLVVGSLLAVNVFTLYLLQVQNAGISQEDCFSFRNTIHVQSQLINKLKGNITQMQLDLDRVANSMSDTTAMTQPQLSHQETNNLTTIYLITPTYARWTQKADLTRLCQTLMHIPKLHWILVEDSEQKTRLVTRFLDRCKVESTHLNTRTAEQLRLRDNEPVWKKNRGVEQRNLAIDWLRENAAGGTLPGRSRRGVVYFADDDNTYDVELFEMMRNTRKVSVWLVGISGGLRFEGPTCRNGKVKGWYTGWGFERPFPIDMAGFAVNFELLLSHPNARIDPNADRGYLESSLLEKIVTMDELEPKPEDCTKVLVWHTRTEVPKMRHEEQKIKVGRPSNPGIET